jgi:dTMP kinase
MTRLFIAFEGGDGAGKSTQVQLLADALTARGEKVVLTREPGGSPIAEKIRDVVLDISNLGLNDRSEALLYAASRAEHVAKIVQPALDRGEIVITDRYMDSSIAYQGAGRNLGTDKIEELNLWATNGLQADFTIILDVEPEHGLSRVADPNRIEEESADFHSVARNAFLQRASQFPDKYLVLNARGDIQDIASKILEAITSRLS